MIDLIELIKDNSSAIIASVAIIGVIFTGLQFRKSKNESEWDRFTDIHNRMQDLREKILSLDLFSESYDNDLKKIKGYTLNELEFYAYTVNKGKLKKTQEMYNDIFMHIVKIYENEFKNTENDRYKEIRTLYKKLNSKDSN